MISESWQNVTCLRQSIIEETKVKLADIQNKKWCVGFCCLPCHVTSLTSGEARARVKWPDTQDRGRSVGVVR